MFETFYGLDGNPFRLTPDPAYYFESLTHRKALSYLSFGLSQREGFIVVTGEVGAGKSILVAHLAQQLDARNVTVGQIVTSALDDEEVLVLAARRFGLRKVRDKMGALGAIEQFLHELAMDGRRALLIVDEAQNLSPDALEELRMLSNFQHGGRPLIQTILLGQPEFRQMLACAPELEQLRQRVIASHHLEAMQSDEIEPYVFHRLTRAGWKGRPTIDHSIWDRMFEVTGGIPRKVNQLMTRLLLLGTVEEANRLDGRMLDDVLSELTSEWGVCPVNDEQEEDPGDADRSGPEPVSPKAESETSVTEPTDGMAANAEDFAQSDEGSDSTSPPTETFEYADDSRERAKTPEAGPDRAGISTAHLEAIESAFAERDEHLSALRAEVERVARSSRDDDTITERFDRKFGELETRLAEQERSLRHVLKMMIDYFETGVPPQNAA